MQQRKINSRALRQLALNLLQQIAGDDEIPEGEREDVATSLVRQWITYDGSATLFVGEQQVYLDLGRTPLGNPCVVPEPALQGWMRQLTQDWKVSPDDLPEILDQLNRGQSAEVVNGDGVPLRLWVNPKERSKGVEPLVKETIPAGMKRDYFKIATTVLEQQFGEGLDPEEMDELARSPSGASWRWGSPDGRWKEWITSTSRPGCGCWAYVRSRPSQRQLPSLLLSEWLATSRRLTLIGSLCGRDVDVQGSFPFETEPRRGQQQATR